MPLSVLASRKGVSNISDVPLAQKLHQPPLPDVLLIFVAVDEPVQIDCRSIAEVAENARIPQREHSAGRGICECPLRC